MFKRAYVEITNVCNLTCSFCPGTGRPPRFMTTEEFRHIAQAIRPFSEYIYLHVMGEPLLHPELNTILDIAEELDYQINITTNGFLLADSGKILLSHKLRKVSVSLHSFEANNLPDFRKYLNSVWDFCLSADCIVALRLWNEGGKNSLNNAIMSFLSIRTGKNVSELPYDYNGRRLGPKLYLEHADKFDWPDSGAAPVNVTYCHGLSDQIAVLCDGTVVPCCLDGEGRIALGNLFETDLETILSSPRARALIDGFKNHCPGEDLCKRCGYATRFN